MTVAAGRSSSGTSSHAASSISSTLRAPASRPSQQAALALEPVGDVLVELGRRVVHRRPMAREQHRQVPAAQLAQRIEIPGQGPGIGRDEHAALSQHRVAGQARAAHDERHVVRGVARGAHHLQWPELAPVAQQAVDVAASRRQRRMGEPFSHRGHRAGMVAVIVGESDPAQPAPPLDLGDDGRRMGVQIGSGIDQPGRI